MTAIVRERSVSRARLLLRPPAMTTLFTLVFALGGWRSGLTRISDNSFFLHLRTGRMILEDWVPRQDPYSFTAGGTDWVAQSWLAEALYGLIDKLAGPFGLRVLTGLTGAVVGALAYRLALRTARDRVRAVVLTLAAVGASFTLWSQRPLFLGIVAFLVLLWVVEAPDSIVGRRPLVSLPVIMWLWANVHGTFALGFFYLALHLAGRWLDGFRPWEGREGDLLRASAVAGAACLLNPYGPQLLIFPLDLLSRGDILRRVTEWRSPDFRTVQGLMLAGWLVVFVIATTRGRGRATRRDLVVAVPFLLLALWAQRNIALAPFVGLPVAARCVALEREPADLRGRLNQLVAAVVLLLAVVWTAEATLTPTFDTRSYPVESMRFLRDEGMLGKRLMTTDRWGGYVILAWWPEQKVFMDDRYDMYPTQITKDYIRFSDADESWDEILDRYDIEVIVWKRGSVIGQLLEGDRGWRRVHRDKVADVYIRRS